MEPLRLLIAFEGIDGAGKWTQIQKVRDWLEKILRKQVPFSSEPADQDMSSSWLGKTIRKMLKGEPDDLADGFHRPSDPFEFQRLYVIHRAELLTCVHRPFFEKRAAKGFPAVLLKERYAMSTVAYGMLSGRHPKDFIKLHEDVIGPQMIWPDLTILLDLSAEEAIRRIAKARGEPEHFEKVETLSKVRANYLRARYIGPFTGKVAVVYAQKSEDEVFESVKAAIAPLLTPVTAPAA